MKRALALLLVVPAKAGTHADARTARRRLAPGAMGPRFRGGDKNEQKGAA